MNTMSRHFKSAFLPWLVLGLSVAAVGQYWQSEERSAVRQHELRFANVAEHITYTLARRMHRYKLLLQGLRGLFNASETVERAEFQDYVASLSLDECCPGVQAVGFCRHVRAADLAAYSERQAADGNANFSVFPAGQRSSYCPVMFIAPCSGLNTRALGFDAYSEPARRDAFERARDTGESVVSDRVMLMQFDGQRPCPGILLVAPVYMGKDSPSTQAERRRAIYGYVYVALRLADFIESALTGLPTDIGMEMRDEQGSVPNALLYRSPNPAAGSAKAGAADLTVQNKIEYFGRKWTLRFTALPHSAAGVEKRRRIAVAGIGLFVGLLLWYATLMILVGNRRLAREINERNKASEDLRRSSQKWRATFDAMLDPIALLAVDATIQQCNRAFTQFLGLNFHEVIGCRCCTLVHGPHDPPGECPVVRTRATLKRETWETQIGGRYLFIAADPVFNDEGSLDGIVHIIRDVTWRRHAEQELSRKNTELMKILDAIPAFVWVGLDPDCRVITGNRYVNEIIGAPAGANLSQTAAQSDNAPAFKHLRSDGTEYRPDELPMQRAVATGMPVMNEEFEYVFSNGRRFFVSGNAVPLFDESGRICGSVAVFFDITRLKRAENEMRVYGARQNALLAAIPDIIAEVDSNKRYIWVNRPGVDFFGDDVLGKEASFYFAGEQDTYEQVQRLFDGDDRTVYIESWQRRRDGYKRLLGWWCHVLRDTDGTVRGVLSTARDITIQKQMQNLLEEKNRELENFVYTVSHDLRSPLITIRTYLGHLVQDIASGDDTRIAQDVAFIQNASYSMNAMLEELLQLSRIGRITGQSAAVSIQDLARDALALVAGQIEKRGVRVHVCEAPVLLYGDRARLVQVLQNLIDNAAKYMGGQPDPKIEIVAEERNGTVFVSVRDNGKGIERGAFEKLFLVFERLGSNEPGTGIGLVIVKRIIEVHGGRIWAESDGPGKGTCFKFTLPVKSPEQA